MRQETYLCDVCGKQRGEANHWQLAHGVLKSPAYLIFHPWSDALATSPDRFHLCGAACAQTLLSRWMSGEPLRPQDEKASK